MADNNTATSNLSKQEKGRFKKLRKRMSEVVDSANVSGFVSMQDMDEWQRLVDKKQPQAASDTGNDDDHTPDSSPQPKFVWRKGVPKGRRTEGAHHRDILLTLLASDENSDEQGEGKDANGQDESNNKKKRPLQAAPHQFYKTLPSWMTLHNPVAMQHVGVIEIHTSTQPQLTTVQQRLQAALHGRSHLVAPTRWFSSHHPKSMSDALLFATPPASSAKLARATPSIPDLPGLFQALQPLQLSQEDMAASEYPVVEHEMTSDKPWIVSPKPITTTSPTIWALDCEMVETVAGRALARFTLVQAVAYTPASMESSLKTRVALDTLVQPEDRVTNYLTQYSGVTAALLENGPTLSLAEIQAYIGKTVTSDDLLVGHSLENDLQVCRWIHPTCVDTALLFSHSKNHDSNSNNGRRSFKYSLRHLSRCLLKRTIQQPNRPHCSHEDAQAALDLAVGRAVHGVAFSLKDTSSLNQWPKLCRTPPVVAVGPNAWLQRYMTHPPNAAHALACDLLTDTNAQALQSFLTTTTKPKARLAYGQFHVRTEHDVDACESLVQKLLATVDNTVVLLITLQCLYEHVEQEFRRRKAVNNPKSTVPHWTPEQEQAFQVRLEECRLGTSLWVGGKA